MEDNNKQNIYKIFEKCPVNLKKQKNFDKFFSLKNSNAKDYIIKKKSNFINPIYNSNKKLLIYFLILNLFCLFHLNNITLTTISINKRTNYKFLYNYYISFALSDIKVNDQSCLNFESQICNCSLLNDYSYINCINDGSYKILIDFNETITNAFQMFKNSNNRFQRI